MAVNPNVIAARVQAIQAVIEKIQPLADVSASPSYQIHVQQAIQHLEDALAAAKEANDHGSL